MGIELVEFTLEDLLERGEEFLFPGGDVPDLIPRRMWKLVQANPDHPSNLPVAACLFANGKRASSITLPNQTVHFDGRSYHCLWGHLWAELEGNPMPGAGGLLLHQLVRRLTKRGIGFAATGPTEQAVKVMDRLGIKRVAFCPRYVLPIRADTVSRRLIRNRALERVGSLAIGAGIAAWSRFASQRLRRDARAFQRCDLDAWNQDVRVLDISPRTDFIHIGRSAEFVGWKEKFSRWSAPAMTPRAFSLLRNNEPAGYVNLRFGINEKLGRMGFENARLLRVMDCVTTGPQATAAAVYQIIEIAREERCDFVEFVSNDPWMVQVARHAKLKASNGMAVYLRKPESWPREIDEEPALWNIGLMESDGAFSDTPTEDPGTR